MTAKLNLKQKELLITEVQKRPLLYDLKNPGYKKNTVKGQGVGYRWCCCWRDNRLVVNFSNSSYSNSS